MVEGERVPGEAAVRPKRCRDPLEAAATIGPRGQMQQRPPRAVDQGRRLLDLKLPYVSFTQVEIDSLFICALSSLREHCRRRVNPAHTPARCLSNWDRNAPGTNRKFDQWPVGFTGKPDVERDVGTSASRPLRISIGPGVVPARHGNTNLCASEAAFGCASVQSLGACGRRWGNWALARCRRVLLTAEQPAEHAGLLLRRRIRKQALEAVAANLRPRPVPSPREAHADPRVAEIDEREAVVEL